MTDDHYEVLGVAPDASAREIKRAYKKRALQYHPDTRPSRHSTAIFRRIQQAYDVLREPESRKHYDWLRAQKQKVEAQKAREAPQPPPRPKKPEPKPHDDEGIARAPEDPERHRRVGRRLAQDAKKRAYESRRAGRKAIDAHRNELARIAAETEREDRERATPEDRRMFYLALALLTLLAIAAALML